MSRPFNRLRRGGRGVIVAALAALALASGVAVGAPAASADTNCQWQPLSLRNGWQSQQSMWDSGDPAYCTDNGYVYLSGSMAQPTAGATEFATLPQQAWPASNLYLSVYTMSGTTGYLMIDTSGRMYAYSGPDGDATHFTSLAGVSFPQASVAQQSLQLLNGWQSANGQWGTGDPSYSVTDGVVHLSGSLNGSQVPSGLGDTAKEFAVLPPDARPYFCTSTETYTYGGVPGTLGLEPAGMMNAYAQGGTIYNTPSAQFTELAGISFPAGNVPGTVLPLANIFKAVPGDCTTSSWTVEPGYVIIDGVVYLTGTFTEGNYATNNGGLVTFLPPAARPTHTLYLTLDKGPAPHASLEICPNGNVYMFGGKPYNGVYSLTGLSYQVSS